MMLPISRAPDMPGGPPGASIGSLLRARAGESGQRPFLTFSDGESGERTELGHATFANWVAKAANLLTDELDLGPGSDLAVRVPTSWTAVVVVTAAWCAGIVVDLDGRLDGGPDGGPEAAVVGEHVRSPDAEPARLVVVGTGMGGRLTTDPGRGIPFAEEVLGHPDDFDGPDLDASAPALSSDGRTWTHGDLLSAATEEASAAGLGAGDRFLSAVPTTTARGLITGPLLALAIGGSVVLVTRTQPDRMAAIAETERCQVILPAR